VDWGEVGMKAGWTIARIIYGLFFLATGMWILVSITTGLLSAPVQPTRAAADFMHALDEARFVDPLLAVSFVLGGGALLFDRSAPLGLILLAPPVVVILGFHLFLSGQILWGPFVAAWFLAFAWRYRRAFVPLWTHRSE
jgi:hypothetical protein